MKFTTGRKKALQ